MNLKKILSELNFIIDQYKKYQKDNSQLALLENNITEFENKIPNLSTVKSPLNKMIPEKLPQYLEPILYAAQSYVALALEKEYYQPLEKNLSWLNKAYGCYQLSLEAIHSIPSARLTNTLSQYALTAQFCLLKINYFTAQFELHALKQQLESEKVTVSTATPRLNDINKVITQFGQALAKEYKSPSCKQNLNITKAFEEGVVQELNLVNILLTTPVKRKPEETTIPSLKEGEPFKIPDGLPKKKAKSTTSPRPDETIKKEAVTALVSLSVFKNNTLPEKPLNNNTTTPQFS